MRKVISLVIPTALSGTSTISQPSASSFTYDNSSRDRRSDTEAGLVSHDDSSGVDTDTGVIGKVEGSDLSVGSILPSDELSHIGTSTSLVTAVDAATFVRELFHLSRNIPLEKRYYFYLFDILSKLFLFAILLQIGHVPHVFRGDETAFLSVPNVSVKRRTA